MVLQYFLTLARLVRVFLFLEIALILPPEGVSWIELVLLLVLAVWGGTVNYVARVKRGVIARFSIVELLGEWLISGFSGICMWLVCVHFSVPDFLTALFVALAGHAGGRTVYAFESLLDARLKSLVKRLEP